MPVNVIDTIKPKNGLSFPIVEAIDVYVDGFDNLADAVSHFATDTAITAISAALDGKADIAALTSATTSLQAQINQIITPVTQDAEVQNARIDVNGVAHTTLKERLDSDFSDTQNFINEVVDSLKFDGIAINRRLDENSFGTPFITDVLYQSNTSQIGVSLANMERSGSQGAKTYLIELNDISEIEFRVFLSSSKAGSYILDENYICIAELLNATETTGTPVNYTVPDNGRYLLYTVSKGLYDTGLDIYLIERSPDAINSAIANIEYRLDENGISSLVKIDKTDFDAPIFTNQLLNFSQSQIGVNVDDIPKTSLMGSAVYKIDVSEADTITFPVFKSSSHLGSCITDEDDICIMELVNSEADTGSYITYKIPDNSKYLLYSVSSGLINSGVDIYVGCEKNAYLKTTAETALQYAQMEKLVEIVLSTGYVFSNVDVGEEVDLTVNSSTVTKCAIENCSDFDYVTISGVGGENARLWAFVDNNNILISKSGANITESERIIPVPDGARYIIVNSTSNQKSYLGMSKSALYTQIDSSTPSESADIHVSENRNLCLGAIKTKILDNLCPYHEGLLLHKLRNDDRSLWYGTTLTNIKKIGVADFYPSQCRLAVSPKDGRVIATVRDARTGIYVWDGESTTLVDDFETKPMAWLYNSGVDFINDSDDEYCIFAEYKSSAEDNGFNVWRGKYPYTSAADWEVVLHQNYGWTGEGNITHFHQIKRDPWTDILYCTSGDSEQSSAVCRWWYSTDYGATWTLLTDGVTSGYEEHITRIINFIFTKDYIYFATDHGTNHCLNRVARDNNGIIDVSSRVKLCDLPEGHATNSLCYSYAPNGIFMYDRIDTGYTEHYGEDLPLQFYDLRTNTLKTITTLNLITNDWGGCRGKCYLNYTNGKFNAPMMGFGTEALCMFDLASDGDIRNIGTVKFNFDGTVENVEI